ncbi:rod shape-determining protein [Streptomycetaceae bacterium NBC_01309]
MTATREVGLTAGPWARTDLTALRSCSLGIELGSDRTRIVSARGGVIADAPSALAVDLRSGKPVAVGDAAVALERSRTAEGTLPGYRGRPQVTVVWPVGDGSADNPAAVGLLLRALLAKAGKRRSRWRRVAVAVPHRSSPLLMLGVGKALESLGVREVVPVATPFAAACAGHLHLADAHPVLSVVCGASGIQAAVLSSGTVVDGDLAPTGTAAVDRALAVYLLDTYGLHLGPRHLHTLYPHLSGSPAATLTLRGWDARNATPRDQDVDVSELATAIAVPLDLMADLVRQVVARSSAEVLFDLTDRGAVLAGSGAAVAGLAERIGAATQLPTYPAPDPDLAVALGIANLISPASGKRRR